MVRIKRILADVSPTLGGALFMLAAIVALGMAEDKSPLMIFLGG